MAAWLLADIAMAGSLAVLYAVLAESWPSPEVWALAASSAFVFVIGTHMVSTPVFYTWTHGLWHVLSCASGFVFAAQSHMAVDRELDGRAQAALGAAAVISASGTGLFVLHGCSCCGAGGGFGRQRLTAASERVIIDE